MFRTSFFLFVAASWVLAAAPEKALNSQVQAIVGQVSADKIAGHSEEAGELRNQKHLFGYGRPGAWNRRGAGMDRRTIP